MAFIPVYILILLITIVIDYAAGILIEKSEGKRRKVYLVTSIISTCVVLIVFKYFNFLNNNVRALADLIGWNYPIGILEIILPIGLSFHTFQSLSYVIEVYRGHQKAEKHFGIYSLYVMFYPQLVAGPIERPQNLLGQFRQKHYFEYTRVKSGLVLMLWGMFKKVVIADRLAVYVTEVYNHPGAYHGWPIVLATYLFGFQVYCDFSGYSDIAIGAARVMGFDLMLNFNKPLLSKTMSEFWRRWHISLSTWFKDYVYFPLGGSRVPKNRWRFNIWITLFISGIWHGSAWTYVLWGGLHGGYVLYSELTMKFRDRIVDKLGLRKLPNIYKALQILGAYHLFSLGWFLFRANNLHDSRVLFSSLFYFDSILSLKILNFKWIEIALSIILIVVLMSVEILTNKPQIEQVISHKKKAVRWGIYLSLFISIIVLGNFGYVEFIYFQF